MNVARMPGSIIKIWKSSKIISIQIQMAQPSVEYEQSWVCVSPMLTPTATATAAPTTTESCKKKKQKKKRKCKILKSAEKRREKRENLKTDIQFNQLRCLPSLPSLLSLLPPHNNGQLCMLLGVVSPVCGRAEKVAGLASMDCQTFWFCGRHRLLLFFAKGGEGRGGGGSEGVRG